MTDWRAYWAGRRAEELQRRYGLTTTEACLWAWWEFGVGQLDPN